MKRSKTSLSTSAGAGVGAVDLVDHHDRRQAGLERLAQHEAGLRQRALAGVHQQQDAVDHLQRPLHLAAEVGVAGGVDDVDPRPQEVDGRVLGHDGDALLALEVDRVHHSLGHVLVGAEGAALPEHRVHQRGLAVVDVGDDGEVAHVVSGLGSQTVLSYLGEWEKSVKKLHSPAGTGRIPQLTKGTGGAARQGGLRPGRPTSGPAWRAAPAHGLHLVRLEVGELAAGADPGRHLLPDQPVPLPFEADRRRPPLDRPLAAQAAHRQHLGRRRQPAPSAPQRERRVEIHHRPQDAAGAWRRGIVRRGVPGKSPRKDTRGGSQPSTAWDAPLLRRILRTAFSSFCKDLARSGAPSSV